MTAGVALARISPSSSYVYATASLAGAGLDDYDGLRDLSSTATASGTSSPWPPSSRNAAGWPRELRTSEERSEIMEAPVDPDDLPAFAPPRRPLVDVLLTNDVDLLVLVVLNGVFFLAAYVGFLRFDLVD